MGIRSRFILAVACGALAGGSVTNTTVHAVAAPGDPDNFVFMNDPSFVGIPDKDTHSGVFLDVINLANQSLTSDLNPLFVRVAFAPGQVTKQIYVFDGNNAGLWDQGGQDVVFPQATPLAIPDVVTSFDVFTQGDGFAPLPAVQPPPVWHAESELTDGPGGPSLPQTANLIFQNANDSRWELLVDAATLPAPAQAAALVSGTGEHVYFVRVKFDQNVGTAINGFKVASNGALSLVSDPTDTSKTTWLGGFIGGVVDAQRHDQVPTKGGASWSFSRDHYPNLLKAGTAGQQLRWPSDDAYDNTYDGTIEIAIHILPKPGQTIEQALADLKLFNADFDDRFDLAGIPLQIGPHVVSPGQPADQGGYYIGDAVAGGNQFDSGGFALPTDGVWGRPVPPATSPVPTGRLLTDGPAYGTPYVEIYAPGRDPSLPNNWSALVSDLSGNVPPAAGTTGFEQIALFSAVPPADRVAGTWILRFRNVDARNSTFIQSNAEFATTCLKGRVFCDGNKDGDDEDDTDLAIAGVQVQVTRTDTVPPTVFPVLTTLADGSWALPGLVQPGTYQITIDPTQPALVGKPLTTPSTRTVTLKARECVVNVDFGFDCDTCVCKKGLLVKKVCFTTDLWVGSPKPSYEVGVEFRDGCCEDKKKCTSPMIDRHVVKTDGSTRGPWVGANGVIEIEEITVARGILTVRFCLTAVASRLFPNGAFEGNFGLRVFVSGCDVKSDCGCLTCASLIVGKRWPACPAKDPHCWSPFGVVTTEVASCEPPPPPPDCGCTRTVGWWKNHHKYSKTNRIPWPGPCGEDTLLCGRSWLSILRTSPRGNAWYILAHQWAAARLNKCRGACVPDEVVKALDESERLLTQACGCISKGRRARAIALADLLDDYNNGLLGVPHCDSDKKGDPTGCPAPKPPPKKKASHRDN